MGKLSAFWAHKQGLDGSLSGLASTEVLERIGWARSVGGANPYLTIFSRNGASRESMDAAVANLDFHELPCARGCTYVVPSSEYAIALAVGQTEGDPPDIARAKKVLGVTDEELARVSEGALRALEGRTLDPKEMKDELGDLVRSFGDAGKKIGVTTSLPMVLGQLQTAGKIRRVPVNGRLDQQRYWYVIWRPSPLETHPISRQEALIQLAKRYWTWIGPATAAHFQWFSGLGVKATKDVIDQLPLVPVEDGSPHLILESERDAFRVFEAPSEPQYAFVGCIDGVLLHQRDLPAMVDDSVKSRYMIGEKGPIEIRGVLDLANNAILDRGRLVGLWEYDSFANELVWATFEKVGKRAEEAAERMQAFARDQLGDVRSFSLDSPESRKPKIEALRKMGRS